MGSKQEIGKNIRYHRELRGLTQAQLANLVGISSSTIAMYETAKREPDMDTLEAIADIFNISLSDLVLSNKARNSWRQTIRGSSKNPHILKLVGSAAAGEPIFDEEVDAYVYGPTSADCAVRVKGDSMTPTYLHGDLLYVRSQSYVDYDGQIAVVICGDEACVKHVYRQPDGLLLASDNAMFAPMLKKYADYDGTIRILGKVIGFTRMYQDQ